MELTPNYNRQLYFGEKDIETIGRFDGLISVDPHFKDLGKGKNKFSASVRQIIRDYLDMTSNFELWKRFLEKIEEDNGFKDKNVGKIVQKFIEVYME